MQDALKLQKRPFAHNTSLILVVTAFLYLLTSVLLPAVHLDRPFTRDLPSMFFVATLSHHLRDADRRGLWLAPLPSSPPLPHMLYPFLIVTLPSVAFAPRMLPVVVRGLVEAPKAVRRTKRTSALTGVV